MQIAFNVEPTASGRFYTLETEKVRMTVYVSVSIGYVQARIDNSSARVWRGPGKVFHGADALDKAIEAYKSGACKEMLRVVQDAEKRAA